MHFKLLIAFVDDSKTNAVMDEARRAGATGATVINNARGEGLALKKTFFGLSLETQRDVILFLVEEHLSRQILEKIAEVGNFEEHPGTGIAIQVDVEDNGIGIDPEYHHRIFEGYYRGDDPLVVATVGTGLTLAITRTVVEMHNGRIWFTSEGEQGKGSVFSFALPVHREE